MPVLYITNALH